MIMSLVALATINASAATQYVTVRVCGQGEIAEQCQMVTYAVRPASPSSPAIVTCPKGELDGPCPTVTGVPAWLKALNKAFADAGFTAPVTPEVTGGPN